MNIFSATDKQFHEKHPELNGRQLSLEPEDKALRQEYKEILNEKKKTNAVKSKDAPIKNSKCIHNDSEGTKDNNQVCNASSFKIGKADKGYVLNIPGTNLDYKNDQYKNLNVLEIVSGPPKKPSKISINISGIKGPCNETHVNKAFNFNENDLKIISNTDTKLEFNCFSQEFSTGKLFSSFKEVLRYIFVSSSIKHDLNYGLCGFNYDFFLKVFPDLEAAATVTLNHEISFSKKGKSISNDSDEDRKGLEEKLKYSFSINHAGESIFKLDSSQNDKDVGYLKFLLTLLDNLSYVSKGLSIFLGESQSLKISFAPTVSGNCALKEVPGKPFVDKYYKISIGFSPLFQIEADADVSGELLIAIPGIGLFLAAALHAVETAKLGECFVGFKINGNVGLTADFERQAGSIDNEKKVAIKSTVKINLLGKVASNLHVWKFHYSAGAKVGAESGIKVEDTALMDDENGLYFPLILTFLGITVYYQTWSNKGVSLADSSVPRAAKMEHSLGANTFEKEDVENIPEESKSVVVAPREIYNGKFYVL